MTGEAETLDKKYCPYCMAPAGEGHTCPKCGRALADYMPQPHHLQPGTVLADRYAVGGVLGEGGFGITYIGLDRRLETRVAVKEYYPRDKVSRDATVSVVVTSPIGPQAKSYEKGKQRFLKEAQIMARMVKQPAIVTVQDFFEANNTAYIVMEYVDGVTLKTMTERRGHIPPGELLPLIEPIFGALATLHKTGLIHRDISPDNIMVEDGRARLLDFGCAREAEGSETQTVTLKHGYAPMEQYGQKGQGPWTDVYALSATIYYCLTGVVPPRAPDRLVEDTLMLPIKLGAALTETEEKALLRGMNAAPQGRLQSMEDLHDALYDGLFPEEKEELRRREEQAREKKRLEEERRRAAEEKKRQEQEARQQKQQEKQQKQQQKRSGRRTGLWAVLSLAAVALVAGVLGFLSWRDSHPDSAVHDPGSGKALKENTFDNAQTIAAGVYGRDDLESLMESDGVKAVALEAGAVLDLNAGGSGEYVLPKPLLVREGAALRANHLRVPDGSALQVDGTLDCRGLITLEGSGTRLYVNETGGLTGEGQDCAVILMDDGQNLALADSGLLGRMGTHVQITPRKPENAVSVTAVEDLAAAVASGKPISIDQSISLPADYTFDCAYVWVSEGVTVRVRGRDSGGESTLCFESYGDGHCTLVNCGTIRAAIWADDDTVIYNYGSIEPFDSHTEGYYLEGGVLLLNFGDLEQDLFARIWDDGLLLNTGTVTARDMYMVGADMVNLGRLLLPEMSEASGMDHAALLGTEWDSVLYNSGTIVCERGSELDLYGWTVNDGGTIDIQDGLGYGAGSIYNMNGSVTVGGESWPAGVVYGPGTARLATDSLASFQTDSQAGLIPADCTVVESADALWASAAAGEKGRVVRDIELNQRLVVAGTLYICGKVTAPSVTVSGGQVYICGGGSLVTDDLRLEADSGTGWFAKLSVSGGGSLKVTETLEAESSALFAAGGSIDLTGAQVSLRDRACFIPMRADSLAMNSAQVTAASRSLFMTPMSEAFSARDMTISAEDSTVRLLGEVRLNGADIDLTVSGPDQESILEVAGRSAVFQDSQISSASEGCTIVLRPARLELAGSALYNAGYASIDGWLERTITMDRQSHITNAGYMDWTEAEETDVKLPVLNRGELHYHGDGQLVEVVGEHAIYDE